jgi:hypothetical protein
LAVSPTIVAEPGSWLAKFAHLSRPRQLGCAELDRELVLDQALYVLARRGVEVHRSEIHDELRDSAL